MSDGATWRLPGPLAILGTGRSLPGEPLPTDALIAALTARLGFTRGRAAKAIAAKLAIHSRHVSRPFVQRHEAARCGQSNPELAADAVSRALADAGLKARDLGYLIGHTTTPLTPLPSNIAWVADRIGYAGPHVELRQACTGFANAVMIAHGLLMRSDSRPVAIVGSETGSLFFDPDACADDDGQIVNLVQMGDGAGAIILGPRDAARAQFAAAWFGAAGLGKSPGLAMADDGRSFTHDFSGIRDGGPALFDLGVGEARAANCAPTYADVVIGHQVSGRIGDELAKRYGFPPERSFVNADRIGNTGSAAIWIALAELRDRALARDTRVLVLGAEATKYMYGGLVYNHG